MSRNIEVAQGGDFDGTGWLCRVEGGEEPGGVVRSGEAEGEGVRRHPSAPGALELAIETGRTVYDCLYLAVAIAERGVMVTADERLVNGLRAGVFGRWVRWVGEG